MLLYAERLARAISGGPGMTYLVPKARFDVGIDILPSVSATLFSGKSK